MPVKVFVMIDTRQRVAIVVVVVVLGLLAFGAVLCMWTDRDRKIVAVVVVMLSMSRYAYNGNWLKICTWMYS